MKFPLFATLGFVCSAAFALAQHSPAPDRPAEGPQRANPGSGPAPGVHPPAPMDGNRFAPGPPPGSQETPPGGRVKTEEKVSTVTPTPGGRAATTPTAVTTPARRAATVRTPTPAPRRIRTGPPAPGRTPAPPRAAAATPVPARTPA